MRMLFLNRTHQHLNSFEEGIEERTELSVLDLHLGRDWPKYPELLKNVYLQFIRATADHPLPTRLGGQQSEQISSRLKSLIRYLGQSRKKLYFLLRNNSSPTPSLQLKEGVSIPYQLPLYQKGKRTLTAMKE